MIGFAVCLPLASPTARSVANNLAQHPHALVEAPWPGQNCIGPDALVDRMLCSVPCTKNLKIDESTTDLIRMNGTQGGDDFLRLRLRCASCHYIYKVVEKLRRTSLAAAPDQVYCAIWSCFRANIRGVSLCTVHLFEDPIWLQSQLQSSMQMLSHYRPNTQMMQKAAASIHWRPDESLTQVHLLAERIRRGQTPGNRLVCLDLEYSFATKNIFEIGICEAVSGRSIIDARIRHDCTFEELTTETAAGSRLRRVEEVIGQGSARRVYGVRFTAGKDDLDAAIRSKHLYTAAQVADVLRNAGICLDTMFVAWARGKSDLMLLRNFLEAAGHTDIIPPNEKCFLPLHNYNQNLKALPNGKRIPLKLEILFPLLFPQHDLVGKNHRAMNDAQQLRLVMKKLEDYCFREGNFQASNQTLDSWILQGNSGPNKYRQMQYPYADSVAKYAEIQRKRARHAERLPRAADRALGKHYCSGCGYKAGTAAHLRLHVPICKGAISYQALRKFATPETRAKNAENRRTRSRDAQRLSRAANKASGKYSCSDCPYKASDAYALRLHVPICQGFIDPIQRKQKRHAENLRNAAARASGKFHCSKCGYNGARPSDLKNHAPSCKGLLRRRTESWSKRLSSTDHIEGTTPPLLSQKVVLCKEDKVAYERADNRLWRAEARASGKHHCSKCGYTGGSAGELNRHVPTCKGKLSSAAVRGNGKIVFSSGIDEFKSDPSVRSRYRAKPTWKGKLSSQAVHDTIVFSSGIEWDPSKEDPQPNVHAQNGAQSSKVNTTFKKCLSRLRLVAPNR